MLSKEFRDWLSNRSLATRRFILFGLIGFLAALAVITLQSIIWASAGWGSANFLPVWALVLCYVFGTAVGMACFYYVLASSSRFEGRIRWFSAVLVSALATFCVAGTLAHSIPQLSTLLISSPKMIELKVHDIKGGSSATGRRKICGMRTSFGPVLAFRGKWCGIRMGKGSTYLFKGQGNALAMRITSYKK